MNGSTINFGACCFCGSEKLATCRLMCLDKKAPVPGTGWGCVLCRLPADGAFAVVCDECACKRKLLPTHAVSGWVGEKKRVSIVELKGEHKHNPRFHPENALRN